jgi:hypothetical protein
MVNDLRVRLTPNHSHLPVLKRVQVQKFAPGYIAALHRANRKKSIDPSGH